MFPWPLEAEGKHCKEILAINQNESTLVQLSKKGSHSTQGAWDGSPTAVAMETHSKHAAVFKTEPWAGGLCGAKWGVAQGKVPPCLCGLAPPPTNTESCYYNIQAWLVMASVFLPAASEGPSPLQEVGLTVSFDPRIVDWSLL